MIEMLLETRAVSMVVGSVFVAIVFFLSFSDANVGGYRLVTLANQFIVSVCIGVNIIPLSGGDSIGFVLLSYARIFGLAMIWVSIIGFLLFFAMSIRRGLKFNLAFNLPSSRVVAAGIGTGLIVGYLLSIV